MDNRGSILAIAALGPLLPNRIRFAGLVSYSVTSVSGMTRLGSIRRARGVDHFSAPDQIVSRWCAASAVNVDLAGSDGAADRSFLAFPFLPG